MTSWLGDWANLLLRWTHFIAGIAWIGSSFYFIWLDRALSAPAQPRPGVEGDLWMVHSGGFYQVEKRRPSPGEIPPVLHWFKYEALFTWITGIALLVLVYYLTGAYLLDPTVSRIGRGTAVAAGIGVLVVGWLVYDLLWRSPLAGRARVATAISLLLLAGVSFAMCRLLSGRAAFMHVGSLLGTIMVANVWVRILPAQQQMLDATRAGRAADFTLGERAKVRSVHNSYMTFPLLFIMLSNHFPATYANPQNWLVLFLLFIAGGAVRHAMIGGGGGKRERAAWALVPAVLALAGAVFLSTPKGVSARTSGGSAPGFVTVRAVITQRCQPCHSQYQTDSSFGYAPGGVTFDTPESIARLAERIRVRAVETNTMPLANKTGMTDDERDLLARWIEAGAPLR
jgi:uncharacterized membrane protein